MTCSESASNPDITGLLRRWGQGDVDALGQLMMKVYAQLRRLSRREVATEFAEAVAGDDFRLSWRLKEGATPLDPATAFLVSYAVPPVKLTASRR